MKKYRVENLSRLYKWLVDNHMTLASCNGAIQLDHMQAWMIPCEFRNDDTGEIIEGMLLQSYKTIVSVYPYNSQIVRLGKWSTTTSKHQTRFERKMLDNYY